MSLAIRRAASAKYPIIIAFAMAFALMTQSIYAVITSQTVNAVALEPCSAITNVHFTSLVDWDLSATSVDGSASNQVTADGLHVKTEATGHRKAAAYYPVDFELRSLGTDRISDILTMTVNSGAAPGAQLVVDFNNDGTNDGILVGESIYGNNWWLTNSAVQFAKDGAPQTGGGNGSNWFGTASEWYSAFPDARVKAIGYSLGSGMTGDVTITKITAGCTEYTFGPIAPTATITTPAADSTVGTNGNILTITGTFTDDIMANYLTLQLVYKGNSKAIGTVYGYGSVFNPAATYADASGNFSYDLAVPSDLEDGEYSLFYTGTDFTGGITDRMERKFIIDTTAPGVPVLETPANDATITTNAFWFEWSDVTDAVSYEVQFSQNDATDVSGALNVGVWSGDAHHNQPAESRAWSEGATGTWYWQVRSVDAAGNKSAWTAPWKLIIDLSVDNGGYTSGNEEPTETENNGEQNQGTGGESIPPRTTTDDDNQLTTTIPGFAATALPSLIDTTTSPQNEATIDETDASDVLGEQDQRNEGAPLEDTGEVLGLMDQKFFGLVWYWWLVVLAALVGGWLLLAAAIRRGREENL